MTSRPSSTCLALFVVSLSPVQAISREGKSSTALAPDCLRGNCMALAYCVPKTAELARAGAGLDQFPERQGSQRGRGIGAGTPSSTQQQEHKAQSYSMRKGPAADESERRKILQSSGPGSRARKAGEERNCGRREMKQQEDNGPEREKRKLFAVSRQPAGPQEQFVTEQNNPRLAGCGGHRGRLPRAAWLAIRAGRGRVGGVRPGPYRGRLEESERLSQTPPPACHRRSPVLSQERTLETKALGGGEKALGSRL